MVTAVTLLYLSCMALENKLDVSNEVLFKGAAVVCVVASTGTVKDSMEIFQLAYRESRWNHKVVSSANACGLWQQQPKWIKSTCEKLTKYPIHAALTSVRKVHKMKKMCGGYWNKCYMMGPYHPLTRRYRIDLRTH